MSILFYIITANNFLNLSQNLLNKSFQLNTSDATPSGKRSLKRFAPLEIR